MTVTADLPADTRIPISSVELPYSPALPSQLPDPRAERHRDTSEADRAVCCRTHTHVSICTSTHHIGSQFSAACSLSLHILAIGSITHRPHPFPPPVFVQSAQPDLPVHPDNIRTIQPNLAVSYDHIRTKETRGLQYEWAPKTVELPHRPSNSVLYDISHCPLAQRSWVGHSTS